MLSKHVMNQWNYHKSSIQISLIIKNKINCTRFLSLQNTAPHPDEMVELKEKSHNDNVDKRKKDLFASTIIKLDGNQRNDIRGNLLFPPLPIKINSKKKITIQSRDIGNGWVKMNSGNLIKTYMDLSKFRLTMLIATSTVGGYFMAPVVYEPKTFLTCLVGTSLMSCSANAFNQMLESPYDSQMKRTQNRLLVTNKISPFHAFSFANICALTGGSLLYFGCNPLTAFLGLLNIGLYAGIYTPMKRHHIGSTWMGAIVGAIPPVMGYVAVSGQLDLAAFVLAAVQYSWQFPHFNGLSWNLRADYSRAGYRVMCVTDEKLCRKTTLRHSLALLGICSIAAPLSGLTSYTFAIDSLPLNIAMCYFGYKFYKTPDAKTSRNLFKYSLLYLPLIMILMVISRQDNKDISLLFKYSKKGVNCNVPIYNISIDKYRNGKVFDNEMEKQCIEAFNEFYPRYRITEKYKINYCNIDKNFSTMMTAIICYLENEKLFEKKHFKDEIFNRRSCGKKNEGTDIEEIKRKFMKNDKDWIFIAVIRDPLERFVSGFVDKCVINREWLKDKRKCGGCRMDIKCFLEYLYDRMYRRSVNGERLNNFDDQHFFPQNWRCQFNKYMNKYEFIKYSSTKEGTKEFMKNLFKILKQKNISDSSINFIEKEINYGRTYHSTFDTTDKEYFTNILLKNKYLLDLFLRMYYYDYQLFSFTSPKI
uniref:Protoheme IX farnesyltransferase, mitochondrial n=1 Tax=Parastrongyloides trichosuri TaxID=131310 RepID=A0A0N5A1U7_PARTI